MSNSFLDIEDILRKVQRLEIISKRLANESFCGSYQSSFKGHGLDFRDFVEYLPGDDIRFIDWKLTAKTGKPFIKTFQEERQQQVILSVDLSHSMEYGSHSLSKRELAAQLAAVIGFSAMMNGDLVGLHLFSHQTELFLPPSQNLQSIGQIIREILTSPTEQKPTNWTKTLDDLFKKSRKNSILFVISDFIHALNKDSMPSFKKLRQKHEVIALQVFDPIEKALPNVGKITLCDIETNQQLTVNTANPKTRTLYREQVNRQERFLHHFFSQNQIDFTQLSTAKEHLPTLLKLFQSRKPQHF